MPASGGRWTAPCVHGAEGDGKGALATDMKLKIVDFTDPATLKDHSDGELFYIIKTGHQDMPQEGTRGKARRNMVLGELRSVAREDKAVGRSQVVTGFEVGFNREVRSCK
jgi:hypothetical protein